MGTTFDLKEPLPQEPIPPLVQEQIPPLQNGDRMARPEFERRYTAMPGLKKAELVEGRVYMPSPVHQETHGRPRGIIVTWLGMYSMLTPDVELGDNSSVRFDWHNEPQPDALLMLPPERGGQARVGVSKFIEGAPELVVEVSASSMSYDLHEKLEAYERNGVREYIVWRVLDREIDWFVLREGRYARLTPGADGLFRSEVFPGLWLDAAALIAGNLVRVYQVAHEGLALPEHAAFVQ